MKYVPVALTESISSCNNVNEQEWTTFMDQSEKGVIMFSLGTIANTSMMPMDLKV